MSAVDCTSKLKVLLFHVTSFCSGSHSSCKVIDVLFFNNICRGRDIAVAISWCFRFADRHLGYSITRNVPCMVAALYSRDVAARSALGSMLETEPRFHDSTTPRVTTVACTKLMEARFLD